MSKTIKFANMTSTDLRDLADWVNSNISDMLIDEDWQEHELEEDSNTLISLLRGLEAHLLELEEKERLS